MSRRASKAKRFWHFSVSCLVVIAVAFCPASIVAADYVGPMDVVASPDGQTLYVVAKDAQKVEVIDIAAGKTVRSVACPTEPTGLAISADGGTLYITCSGPKGVVCVAEAASGNVERALAIAAAAEVMSQRAGVVVEHPLAPGVAEQIEALKATVPRERLDELMGSGAAMTPAEVLAMLAA